MHSAAKKLAFAAAAPFATALIESATVGNSGHQWRAQNTCTQSGGTQMREGRKTQVRSGSPRLQNARQFFISCRYRQMDSQFVALGDLFQYF